MKTFRSSNGHLVKEYGRLCYHITSASRVGKVHTVDLEGDKKHPMVCSCEAFHFFKQPCRHCRAAIESLIAPLRLQGEDLDQALSDMIQMIWSEERVKKIIKQYPEQAMNNGRIYHLRKPKQFSSA